MLSPRLVVLTSVSLFFILASPLSSDAAALTDSLQAGALWVSGAEYSDTHQQDPANNYKTSALTRYLVVTFTKEPTMSAAHLRSHYEIGDALLNDGLFGKPGEPLRIWGKLGSDVKVPLFGLPISLKPFLDTAADAVDSIYAHSPGQREVSSAVYRQSLNSREVFMDAYKLALKYPATFGKALSVDMLGKYLWIPANATLSETEAAYRRNRIPLPDDVRDALNSGKSPVVLIRERKEQLRAAMAKHVDRLSPQPASRPWVGGPTIQAGLAAQVANIRAQTDTERQGIAFLTNVMLLSGDKNWQTSARTFSSLANATINVTEAIRLYNANPLLMSEFGLAVSVSTALVSLSGVLDAQGISPEAAYMREIAAQMALLRKEMHERFDEIDKKLAATFELLVQTYAKLLEIGADLQQVRTQLAHQANTLRRLEARTLETATLEAENQFKIKRSNCLDYSKAATSPMSERYFADCLTTFSEWAVGFSQGELGSPLQDRDSSPAAIWKELGAFKHEFNIVYLNRLLADHFSVGTRQNSLGNPKLWQEGTATFIVFASANPQLFYKAPQVVELIDRISSVGSGLRSFAADIAGGEDLSKRREHLNRLFSYYHSKATAVAANLSASRLSFYRTLATGESLLSHPQDVVAPMDLSTIAMCDFTYSNPDRDPRFATWQGGTLALTLRPAIHTAVVNAIPQTLRQIAARKRASVRLCYSGLTLSNFGGRTVGDLSVTYAQWHFRIKAKLDDFDAAVYDVTVDAPYVGMDLVSKINNVWYSQGGDIALAQKMAQQPWTKAQEEAAVKTIAARLVSEAADEVAFHSEVARAGFDAETQASLDDLSGAKTLLENAIRVGFPTLYIQSTVGALGTSGLFFDRQMLTAVYECFGRGVTCGARERLIATCLSDSPDGPRRVLLDSSMTAEHLLTRSLFSEARLDSDPSIVRLLRQLAALKYARAYEKERVRRMKK